MKRKKVIGLLLLLFVSLIIAAALLLQQEKQKLYVSPSGIITRLEAYEFSTNRVHYRLPKGTWRHKLLNLLPGAVRPQESHYVVSPTFAGEPLLSAAFSFKSPADESVFALRVISADENGNEFDPVGQQAGMSSGNPVYWATEVPAFPRRGSSVLLKVKQNADLIAEFRIPNPARGSYPQWKAKELPVVSGPNEFQAALLEFKTQFEDKYSPEQFPSTLCAFKVMENGSPTKNWLPGSGEIFDATGNHWRIFFDRRLSRTEGDTQFRTFMGALWAGEDAWKLEITFEKVAGFSDDELIRFDNLPVLTGTNVFQSRVLRKALIGISSCWPLSVQWEVTNPSKA